MPDSAKVAIIRCESYSYENIGNAVRKGLALLGGASQFTRKGEEILLKPNILSGEGPEKCIGPHPIVFRAVAEQFLEAGAMVSFGDSPGFGNALGNARKAGFLDIAQPLGIPFADFDTAILVQNPDGKLINKFEIAKGEIGRAHV